MIKLIVCDLDGTLLDKPNAISQENLEAIEYAYQRGARFGFATGREWMSIQDIKAQLTQEPLLILSNGAIVCEGDGTVVHEDYFPNQYLEGVIDVLAKNGVPYMIFATDGFYTTMEPEDVRDMFIERIGMVRSPEYAVEFRTNPEKPCNRLVRIADMAEFLKTKKIFKVEGFHVRSEPIEAAKRDLEPFTELSHLSTGINNVEVTHITAQKGLVLKKYVESVGIAPDEVMVMGDSDNDLSLFEHFQYSFAPANSCDAIKAKAYCVVKSCLEHGVSDAIYRFIK